MDTCLEWLSHVRPYVVAIAIHAGMPAVAIRHGIAAIKDLSESTHVCLSVCLYVCVDIICTPIQSQVCVFVNEEDLL